MTAARTYEPRFGDLPPRAARSLVHAMDEALRFRSGTFLVPTHNTEAYWAPSMLTAGFTWPRWRDPADGFEPYEDKLREWSALGPDERSEDFLFTAVQPVSRYRPTLGASMAFDRSNARNSVEGTVGAAYGNVVLSFDPRTLANATVLPGVTVLGQHGAQAGSIEHLPELLAARVASHAGFTWDTERSGWEALGYADQIPAHEAEVPSLRAALLDAVGRGTDDRVLAVRMLLYGSGFGTRNPVEAHIRGLTPRDVLHVEIEPPRMRIAPRGSEPRPGLALRLSGPIRVRGGDRTVVSGLVDPHRLDAIESAARQARIPVTGISDQRRALAAAQAVLQRAGAERITVQVAPDEPPRSTAVGTTGLRRRAAAARDQLGAPAAD